MMEEAEVTNATEKVFSLPANQECFAVLRNRLVEAADEWGIPEKNRKEILTAADEIFTNISCYAYPASDGTVEISIRRESRTGCVALTFSDSGIAFNPLEEPEPNTDERIEDRPIGGLGIHLVRKIMDSMEYRRENGRNILVLKKTPSRENDTQGFR